MAGKKKPQPRKLATQYVRGPDTLPQTETYEGDPLGGWLVVERHSRVPGTGSYDSVKRNGIEYLRARVWRDNAKGVRVRKSVYAQSQRELTRKLKELGTGPALGDVKKTLVGDYLTNMFLPGIKLKVRANTYASYEQSIRNHIVPSLGKAKLATLTAGNADAWLSELKIGPRAKQRAFVVLKRSLSYACDDLQLLDRNPLERMRAPRVPKREPRILNLEEVRRLLDAASETEWFALFYLAIATAMRQGEIFGLTWDSVDLKRGTIRVSQALATDYDEGDNFKQTLAEPKTNASRRTIDLPKEAIAALQAHREKQKPPSDLVFPAEQGGYLDRTNFRKRIFCPLIKEAKLPKVTFHSLRHAGNTLLAASGVPLSVLQRNLGHSTSRVTLDVYSHATRADSRAAAARMGSLLSGTRRGTNGSRRATGNGKVAKKKAL